jgi:hypothetical protein
MLAEVVRVFFSELQLHDTSVLELKFVEEVIDGSIVIPAQAGIQNLLKELDSGSR